MRPRANRFERLAKQSGFEGRLVILAEPEIDAGDCKIEWADGGSCWSARRSTPRSTNSSDAILRPAIRPQNEPLGPKS